MANAAAVSVDRRGASPGVPPRRELAPARLTALERIWVVAEGMLRSKMAQLAPASGSGG